MEKTATSRRYRRALDIAVEHEGYALHAGRIRTEACCPRVHARGLGKCKCRGIQRELYPEPHQRNTQAMGTLQHFMVRVREARARNAALRVGSKPCIFSDSDW